MKWLLPALLFLLLLLLQGRLWFAEGSLPEQDRLRAEVARQEAVNAELRRRNGELEQEVLELQSGGLDAVEAKARRDLGMIKPGERYYQVVAGPPE